MANDPHPNHPCSFDDAALIKILDIDIKHSLPLGHIADRRKNPKAAASENAKDIPP